MWDYDLCICAVPEDAHWAAGLAASIARYRLPKNLPPFDETLGYQRILTDTDGAPFDAQTAGRLDTCRYLLLICSPRTKDSALIRDRLTYFEETRGKQGIIAVLAEGEPIDAFPPRFIEEKLVPHILPDGSIEERLETIEPVASDLRAQSPGHAKQLLRYETVRIVASLLGLAPDMLEQRHNRRVRQRVTAIVATVGIICLTVGVIFSYFGLRAMREGDIAAQQTAESLAVIQRVAEELPADFAGNEAALSYVYESVFNALQTLHEAGSVNWDAISVTQILAPQGRETADTLLRRASIARLAQSGETAALYADAARVLGADEALFLAAAEALAALDYPAGAYVLAESETLAAGDVILTVDGQRFAGPTDFEALLSETIDGMPVELALFRLEAGAPVTQSLSLDPQELRTLRAAIL